MSETSLPSSTAEDDDLRALATLMGWRLWAGEQTTEDPGTYFVSRDTVTDEPYLLLWNGIAKGSFQWSPFTDPRADLQVLERVREVWGESANWKRFVIRFASPLVGAVQSSGIGAYAAFSVALRLVRVGDYARAALAVLREMEEG